MLSKLIPKAGYALVLCILTISGNAQLKAAFSANFSSGCAPLVISFTDQSTGNPNQWNWDLGNGTNSVLKNPSVTYLTPGQYTVKLVIRNAANSTDSVIKLNYIKVYGKPTVQFNASATTGCFPLDVQFGDQSVANFGTVTSWNWDFGDGITSILQSPAHTYTAGGNYNVTLQVTNSNGCIASLSKTSFIQISNGALADFSKNAKNTCGVPATIIFKNLSTGTGALTYKWFFGDGGTSAGPDPSHTYTVKGTYDVQLIVTNNTGCTDTITKLNAVTVGTVDAKFTSADSVCENSALTFTNASLPVPGSITWDFGDGSSSALFNPSKIYTTAGLYTVKMKADFGACIDSVTKQVRVLAGPVVSFTADDTADCRVPFTVNFTNFSSNAISYKWIWGDGTNDIAATAHTYNAAGSFSVELIATSKDGCVVSAKKNNYITLARPKIVLNNIPDSACAPFTKNFSTTITTLDPITGYAWHFGDGNTSASVTPVNTYNLPGVYDVKLIIQTAGGCKDSVKITKAIIASTKPVVAFSATPRNTCAKTDIQFKDETTGGASKWLWRFGDGSTSTVQNPTKKYVDTGYFDVQLIVWNRGCADSVKILKYIHIDPPVAKFTVKLNCNKPLERIFTDASIGADQWLWDFGDGNTSAVKSPVYSYAAPGRYTVSLKVVNNQSGCDFTTIQIIDVVDVKAAFFASDTIVCKGKAINFSTGINAAVIRTFNWNFGDGSPSVNLSANPSYTYNTTGTFSVRLTVTDILGCQNALNKPAYIKAGGPTAKFGSAVKGSCLNNNVIFNDSSTTDGAVPLKFWTWTYGDGFSETLTAAPFQHSYTAAGLYTVQLKVTDSAGCTDSVLQKNPLSITKPAAAFSSADTATCPGKPVNFTSQSTGSTLIYKWNFGDGSTSPLQNPSHSYTGTGSYHITLTITDVYGCTDSVKKINFIRIISVVPSFSISDSFSICPPLFVQFTDLSSAGISKKWDFGDSTSSTAPNPSHFYTYPGTYVAKLFISSPGGCVQEAEKTIIVKGPTGSFTYKPTSGCIPMNVNFVANTTSSIAAFIWDFNDGNTLLTTIDSMVSHTYLTEGKYVPKLILINTSGCQVPVTGKDTIIVHRVTANFNFINKPLCDSGFIAFSDSSYSTDVITGYKWSFGDGNTAVVKNPIYHYTDTGFYYPSLITSTQAGCTDTFETANPIKVVNSPQISMTETANGCAPLSVNFKGNVLVADTSALTWKWIFGNANTSLLQNPPVQLYTNAGSYDVDLLVTNSSGCIDTASKKIEAFIVPDVDAGEDVVLCSGSSVTLTAAGADSYQWSPANNLNCTNCASPSTNTNVNRTYLVTGTTVNGCSAKDSVKINVKYPIKITYSKPAALCKGDVTRIESAGAYSYEWSPSTGLQNPLSAATDAQPDTSTNYRIIGTDSAGCFKDTGFVLLTVNNVPSVSAGDDQTVKAGLPLDLMPTISSDVTDVYWSPTNGVFRNVYPGVTVKPVETTEYTVEVQNNKGCRARDKVTVFVACENSNVFVPNTFSPNADGSNDIFYPRGTGLFKVKNLRIYNRWGQPVFDRSSFNANDPASGWDGTFKGVKLGADVFVYTLEIICSNKSVLVFRGNIALLQ